MASLIIVILFIVSLISSIYFFGNSNSKLRLQKNELGKIAIVSAAPAFLLSLGNAFWLHYQMAKATPPDPTIELRYWALFSTLWFLCAFLVFFAIIFIIRRTYAYFTSNT